ncbi:putative non-specific serine/threonine protein kinase [Helianthus annuus]|uniref:Non-specific serine/threonine protein kinase n=1 Tax=Helianthus annuus TaxID=4232 RepID=A0A9K3N432_HELAN|nr:putative non-specific serine/threonine protein kinase [Helianthus annuus]KAJ0513690.1 putative non-specific serine/threonine protein kinase [Helianthus annuus]KAJ0521576.1 putative non-specific serine/threonine protein kinase [Helianthus annuus]KAJ0529792.1 putative non-specific serine/threonine protein kinase [Helianthus annuus]KAJ0696667.1 putative non-specific serine/threonine protein kinase [Helianthus annuus]
MTLMHYLCKALLKHATDAMKESRVHDFLTSLEALDRWDETACSAYEIFDKDGNRAIMIDELVSVSNKI